MNKLILQPGQLDLNILRQVYRKHILLELSKDAEPGINAAEQVVLDV